jgi:hypothetical protein
MIKIGRQSHRQLVSKQTVTVTKQTVLESTAKYESGVRHGKLLLAAGCLETTSKVREQILAQWKANSQTPFGAGVLVGMGNAVAAAKPARSYRQRLQFRLVAPQNVVEAGSRW